MEQIFSFIVETSSNAYWILFVLLLLAGLNVPLSLDLILISGGALGSLHVEDHLMRLYLFLLAGCILSAWEAYWIGRSLGPKLYTLSPFKSVITKERVERLNRLFEKFGIFLFIVVRFIPGGVRNALFMTSGLGKMPFHLFALRDSLGCFFSATALFSLGYFFAEKREALFQLFEASARSVIVLSAIVLLFISLRAIMKKRSIPKEEG